MGSVNHLNLYLFKYRWFNVALYGCKMWALGRRDRVGSNVLRRRIGEGWGE